MSAEPTSVSHSRSYRQAALYEAGIWRSLYRWLTRRPRSDDRDAALFGYASQVTPVLLAFIALSALEDPDPPAPSFVASRAIQPPRPRSLEPHLDAGTPCRRARPSTRRCPHRTSTSLRLPVRRPYRLGSDLRHPSSPLKLGTQASGRAQRGGTILALQGTTNVEVAFREPLPVSFFDGRKANVDVIRFYADTPTELAAAAQAHLAHIQQAA